MTPLTTRWPGMALVVTVLGLICDVHYTCVKKEERNVSSFVLAVKGGVFV